MRTIAIGDIHGALKALKQLLAVFKAQKDDRLIFLGDYVDGWPESAGVIELLIRLEQQQPCIFIKGNHDVWCKNWLSGEAPDGEWISRKGISTIESYKGYTPEQKEKHLAFFNRLKNYYLDDASRLFVHAGFSSLHGVEKEKHTSNFYWDRTLLETALAASVQLSRDSKFYPKRLLRYREIYIGHTPTLKYDITIPVQAMNVFDIDTGAATLGRLSAVNIDTKEYWQSDPVQQLYPNERKENKGQRDR
jgi:serine/threonine protein phosphatase 1